MSRVLAVVCSLAMVLAGSVLAQGFLDPVPQPAAAAAPQAAKPAVPEIKQERRRVEMIVTTVDESAVRARIDELHRQYTNLFTGPELVALLEKTEKAIASRQTELASRAESLDEKMKAIRVQLEELRQDASDVGVRSQLEVMLQAADEIGNAPGTPEAEPGLQRGSDFFPPADLNNDDFGTVPKPRRSSLNQF